MRFSLMPSSRSAVQAAVPARRPVAVGVLGLAVGLLGCQELTSVDAPDVIRADDYASAAGAHALAVGAVTRFATAFGGEHDVGIAMGSALMADELSATFTDPNRYVGFWDSRPYFDQAETQAYGLVHDARQRLLTAIGTFQRVAPDSSARIGHLFALLGYTSIFLGENYCAGVPLSRRDEALRPVYGEPLTTVQMFDSAVAALDAALVHAAGSARELNLTRVGRGRALLDAGRFDEAAAAVADVPTDYVYEVYYTSTFSLHNFFFEFEDAITVPEREGTNGINWRSAHDPRVPLVDLAPAKGQDGVTPLWRFARYDANDAPIRLASGIEARLIEAEAALQSGDTDRWLAIHNALRAGVPGLDPLTDPGSTAGREDLHFRERAFWLFQTGHRLGDLRRLVRQYGRSAETVFPTDHWRDGLSYGSAVNIAPPATEGINPNYRGCLDRDA